MSKRSRVRQRADVGPQQTDELSSAVGPRQPCPCGSGRRYKHCHGRESGAPAPFVARTFAGLPSECDWVALREVVPAATAPLPLRADTGERTVTVCTLLPMGLPAVVRMDGSVLLGLQLPINHGDVSRDLAYALELALDAEPGTQVTLPAPPPPGNRLADLVDPDGAFEVTVHEGFDFWVGDAEDPEGRLAEALATANEAASPTRRLTSVPAAYWTRMGEREFVRWVLPHDESKALDALARLHASGADRLAESGRLLGTFRAHGLIVPVWEMPAGTGPDAFDDALGALSPQLDDALSDESPLTSAQRSARNGLLTRQLTLR